MTVTDPILVIAFNRPEPLAKVLARLREVQPRELYFAVDGARADRPGEADKVQQCRDLIQTVDWDCTVSMLFHEENLGCGLGVSTAISWFFDNVERGIILEDDIIPDPSFFGFCSELLDRYEHDDRVFGVTGCNFVPPEALTHPDDPYRFSQVPHIWGWATWRRAWMRYRFDIAGWRSDLPLSTLWGIMERSIPSTVYWAGTFEVLAQGKVDTWDGQLVMAAMADGAWTATSNVNLVKNIGFDELATHTLIDRHELQPISPIEFPLAEVPVEQDRKADAWTRKHHFLATWRGMAGQAQRFLSRRVT